MFPTLVTGYIDTGDAILACKNNVSLLTQAYKDQETNILPYHGDKNLQFFSIFNHSNTDLKQLDFKSNFFMVDTFPSNAI